MKWQNHQVATGFIVYAATNDALFVAASIFGAVLPDRVEGQPPKESKAYWKWRKNHRTWSHYPPLYLLLLGVAQVSKMYLQNPIAEIFLNLFSYIIVGALLHIAEDGICGKVPILSTKKKYGLKLFKVGSFGEYICTGLIVGGCIIFSFSGVIEEEYNLRERFSHIEQVDIETTYERLKKIWEEIKMKSYSYTPSGVCAKQINFSVDDAGKLHDVEFVGGCPGNLLAIGKLVEGKDAREIADVLRGNDCRGRGTSCADQFALAIDNIN